MTHSVADSSTPSIFCGSLLLLLVLASVVRAAFVLTTRCGYGLLPPPSWSSAKLSPASALGLCGVDCEPHPAAQTLFFVMDGRPSLTVVVVNLCPKSRAVCVLPLAGGLLHELVMGSAHTRTLLHTRRLACTEARSSAHPQHCSQATDLLVKHNLGLSSPDTESTHSTVATHTDGPSRRPNKASQRSIEPQDGQTRPLKGASNLKCLIRTDRRHRTAVHSWAELRPLWLEPCNLPPPHKPPQCAPQAPLNTEVRIIPCAHD